MSRGFVGRAGELARLSSALATLGAPGGAPAEHADDTGDGRRAADLVRRAIAELDGGPTGTRRTARCGRRRLSPTVERMGAYALSAEATEPALLRALADEAGLRVERVRNLDRRHPPGLARPFLDVELLPIADRVEPAVREPIIEDCRTALAPFVDRTGAITGPIEARLVSARAVG